MRERIQDGTGEVPIGIIRTWSQAMTTGEVRSIAATWQCERSSIVIMDLGKLVVGIPVKFYVLYRRSQK